MGPTRARHSNRASRAHSVKSSSRQPTLSLSTIAEAFSDAIAIVETATRAIEASETQGVATHTLRVGIRALLDAYAFLDETTNKAQGGAS
jgi:hypothetical protein